MSWLLRLLRWLNPLTPWLDYRRSRDLILDRQREQALLLATEERALFRDTISAMTRVMEKAFEANAAQNAAFQTFLSGFASPSTPSVREYDEDAEIRRYLEKRGGGTPPELAGLDQLGRFEALLDKMDE